MTHTDHVYRVVHFNLSVSDTIKHESIMGLTYVSPMMPSTKPREMAAVAGLPCGAKAPGGTLYQGPISGKSWYAIKLVSTFVHLRPQNRCDENELQWRGQSGAILFAVQMKHRLIITHIGLTKLLN